MKTAHSLAIAIMIVLVVLMSTISYVISNKMTSYELPITPSITLHFNGTDADHYPSNQFQIRQGQNITLIVDITSEPPNIPVTLNTEPHIGFTKTNGLDLKLSSTHVDTPNKISLYISAGKDATQNTYKTTVWTNTLAGGNITLGTGLKIQVINTTSTIGQIGNPWILGMSSPLQQFRSGVKVQDVKCQPNYFTLIIKSENGYPACVKMDTAQMLIERGWAKTLH